jgi:hypothetical protein
MLQEQELGLDHEDLTESLPLLHHCFSVLQYLPKALLAEGNRKVMQVNQQQHKGTAEYEWLALTSILVGRWIIMLGHDSPPADRLHW